MNIPVLFLLITFTVLFLHVTTWEGMIFGNMEQWLRLNYLPSYIRKPLYDCPICMTPWWGAFIILIGEYSHSIPCYGFFIEVLILFAGAGLNTLLIYIISLARDYIIANGEE